MVDYGFTVMGTDANCMISGSYEYEVSREGSFYTNGVGILGVEEVLEGLIPGSYEIKSKVRDDCNNEGICRKPFMVTGKKPTPVCISSLTVELTPMDLDGDGTIDTAMAVVWAEEFNSSSYQSCEGGNEDSLQYYIEFGSDMDAGALDSTDLDSLIVGCADIGALNIRMWVYDPITDAADYCDVILFVQDNNEACPEDDISSTGTGIQTPGGLNPIGDMTEGLVLYQNQPNPWRDITRIGFKMPYSGSATLTIYDELGRSLKVIEGDYAAGYNQVELRLEEVETQGTLYYQLETDKHSATKRMIIIN